MRISDWSSDVCSSDLLVERLQSKGVRFDAKPEEQSSILMMIIYNTIPFLLILGIWIFVMSQMQNGSGKGAMGFGKSRAKLLTEKQDRVTFDDVAGTAEAREELNGIVGFQKVPARFHSLDATQPKGALLNTTR